MFAPRPQGLVFREMQGLGAVLRRRKPAPPIGWIVSAPNWLEYRNRGAQRDSGKVFQDVPVLRQGHQAVGAQHLDFLVAGMDQAHRLEAGQLV